ncbi:hypothetical protein [Sphingobacterium rhinopitheci]|uniref:hypothetical protein n=1 Tax=Sphingobacterium rhinopitheci TaxID=2781960 RepID=UPI001F521735|nr:hypothetical protein [Sphingobacterium rhinopitheci]MCI0922609.1 hypothetical protein [Sphingobacterium rhinopitheci]
MKKKINVLKHYIKPHFNIIVIQIEEGIAAASTVIKPYNENSEVLVEDFTPEDDIPGNLSW